LRWAFHQLFQTEVKVAAVVVFPDQLIILVKVTPRERPEHRYGCNNYYRNVRFEYSVDLQIHVMEMIINHRGQFILEQFIGSPVENTGTTVQVIQSPPDRNESGLLIRTFASRFSYPHLALRPPMIGCNDLISRYKISTQDIHDREPDAACPAGIAYFQDAISKEYERKRSFSGSWGGG